MKFCRQNVEDLKKYFMGSFLKFPLYGDEVFRCDRVDSKQMSGVCLGNAEEGTDKWCFTFTDKPEEIEFVLPRKSYFEYEGATYFLCRLPAKQYKRGITSDNTLLSKLVAGSFTPVSITLQLINAYTGKQGFSGFRMDGAGSAYPVSRRMAVDSTGRVYIDRVRIGFVDYTAKTIMVNLPLFVHEVEQVVKENNQDIKVLTTKKSYSPAALAKLNKVAPSPQPANIWTDLVMEAYE